MRSGQTFMTSNRTVQAVVFDLGSVLVDWDPRHLYRRLIADDIAREAFLNEICTPAWHETLDAGRPMKDAVRDLTALYPGNADLIAAYATHWPEMFRGPITGTVRLLEALAQANIPLFALSNFPGERFAEFRAAFPFVRHFQGIVLSSEEKLTKPDPRIYNLTCERFGLVPAHTLFIDDRRDNVSSAAACGLSTHHFTCPEMLGVDLLERGLIPRGLHHDFQERGRS